MTWYYCFGEIAVILGGEVYCYRESTKFEFGKVNSSPVIFPTTEHCDYVAQAFQILVSSSIKEKIMANHLSVLSGPFYWQMLP